MANSFPVLLLFLSLLVAPLVQARESQFFSKLTANPGDASATASFPNEPYYNKDDEVSSNTKALLHGSSFGTDGEKYELSKNAEFVAQQSYNYYAGGYEPIKELEAFRATRNGDGAFKP